jgi:hypothetical protein
MRLLPILATIAALAATFTVLLAEAVAKVGMATAWGGL